MRVLVTGGAGFIGGHIVDQLVLAGDEVAVLDDLSSGNVANVPAAARLFKATLRDRAAVRDLCQEFKPDAICHQAAQISVSRSMREPAFDAEVNIVGMLHLLEAAVEFGTRRLVFASSGGAMYGNVDEPADESHPLEPFSPYGISKFVGEQYLRFFARENGLDAIALRYSNVYGPRQNPHGEAGVVAIFADRLLAGEPVTIFGDGSLIRDYVYVSDVARANVAALRLPFGPGVNSGQSGHGSHGGRFLAVNIGTGKKCSVNELAATMQSICRDHAAAWAIGHQSPDPVHAPPRVGDLRSSVISPRYAADCLGWSAHIALRAGLEQTLSSFALHPNRQR